MAEDTGDEVVACNGDIHVESPSSYDVESPSSYDVAAELRQMEEDDDKKAKKRRPGSFWKKPPTYVYADNFGFGVQSYQSMIDYLDEKDSGGNPNREAVHLPLLEERCMKKFDARRPFKQYTNQDIDQFIDKGENIVTQIRQNDMLGLSNVLRRTHTNWSMTRKYVQLVKKSYVGDYKKSHKKESTPIREFEDIEYRAPTPARSIDYRETTPKPNYVDDLAHEFASVLDTLSQSRHEHEREMEMRKQKLKMVDDKFETVVNALYDKMSQINSETGSVVGARTSVGKSTSRSVQATEAKKAVERASMMGKEMVMRNRIRRDDEYSKLAECVNDLTEMESARNQLRQSLRNLDEELYGLGGRVAGMAEQHRTLAGEHGSRSLAMDKIDSLRAQLAASRSASIARSVASVEDEDEDIDFNIRPPIRQKQAVIYPVHTRVTTRPRVPLPRDEVLSDVHARVLKKAGEISAVTSESRRITSRARFVNVFKPRPDTCDTGLIVEPTKCEMNIDHMAKTLAKRGSCQRRFAVDDEVDLPVSNLNTNAIKDYCELRAAKPIEQHPSLSNRVRWATMRARSRTTLLGY